MTGESGDPIDDDTVFERVQACLANLVGGSGHLASYRLDRESFEVTATRAVGDDETEVEFAVVGESVSEFSGLAGEEETGTTDPVDETERLSGTIVLDASGDLVLDDEGRVRIDPWRTLDPAHWPSRDREALDLDDLLAGLESDEE